MIDRNPQIGRILVRKDSRIGFLARKGGIITRVSTKQIYYKDKYGEEHFIRNFAAICDTEEEVQEVLELSNDCFVTYIQWKSSYEKRLAKMTNSLEEDM